MTDKIPVSTYRIQGSVLDIALKYFHKFKQENKMPFPSFISVKIYDDEIGFEIENSDKSQAIEARYDKI